MNKGQLAPYKILILDEQPGPSSWGETTKKDLEKKGAIVNHVLTVENAIEELKKDFYDILIIDLDLGGKIDGLVFEEQIRKEGKSQPILFVTGNNEYLNMPIQNYINAFATGPVIFYDKTSDVDFFKLINEIYNRVDPIRRSLFLMKESGFGEKRFKIGGDVYTVNELLIPNPSTDSFVRALRESLQELILELNSYKEID